MRPPPPVYGWDAEPAEERPSEFVQTTGHSALSGYYLPDELNARAARRRGFGVGFKTLAIVFVVLVALSGLAIHEIARLLRP